MITSTVYKNEQIADGIFDLILNTNCNLKDFNPKPGQFIMLYTDSDAMMLPRPISICDFDGERVRIVFRVVGNGTKLFSKLKENKRIRISKPLGNGYSDLFLRSYALVGGGLGIPPMLFLAKEILRVNPEAKINAFLGYSGDLFLSNEFKALGVTTHVDRSGNVIAVLEQFLSKSTEINGIYSCGPSGMLRSLCALAEKKNIFCEVSIEERMACGFGVCVGCAVKTRSGFSDFEYKKVCKDGPVFNIKELIWE